MRDPQLRRLGLTGLGVMTDAHGDHCAICAHARITRYRHRLGASR